MSSKRVREADDPERDRGILTQADRELLLGEKELRPQSEREARQRIRNRLENALLDIQLLHRRIRDRDREMVAESMLPDTDVGDLRLMQTLGFLFHMVIDTSEDIEHSVTRFEEGNRDAIHLTLRRIESNVLINANVSIDIDGRDPDPDLLYEKFENNEENLEELMYLRREKIIDDDERYFDHLIPRLWENEQTVAFPTEDGMEVLEATEYESVDKFQQAYYDMMEEISNRRNTEKEQ